MTSPTLPAHTPGPWEVGGEGAVVAADSSDLGRLLVAHTFFVDRPFRVRPDANARRIVECVNALEGFSDPSAAKDLLEAARALVKLSVRSLDSIAIVPVLCAFSAALRKAEGGA